MYSFEPTDEQKMLVDSVQRYASTDLRPTAHDADEEGGFPTKIIEKGWELGLLQASIPDEYGGFGEYSSVTSILAAEELAWGDLAGALAVLLPGLYVLPILIEGSEEQKKEYIPDVIEASWKPYTAALLEPSFEFNPQELKTTAQENRDHYTITGEKVYVPFASEAEGMLVYANMDGTTQGFVLPKQITGMEVGERQKLMGINGLPVHTVAFNDVKVPKNQRLGGPSGHSYQKIVDIMRVTMATLAVGLSRAAFEYSRDYAKERDVFGVKVAQKQAIAFMLAEMATEIEAIRLLTWEAAWKLDSDKEDASKGAYLAITGAMDMAMMVTDRAVQILGGHGYIREHPVELWMRNGRGIATFTGLALA
ncbi:MAG: acyl-CoA dehydrogenase family protein [Anaerolineales bacterium]|nr:acyl-CoA dehydrogenase family protein [Anaerolineales bacterium]